MKTLNKNIRREFKMSLGRFLSVSALLMLGVFILIGLNVTGPNMRQTAQKAYDESNLADAKITTTSSLNRSDQDYLKDLKQVKQINFGHSKDTLIKNTQHALRIESVPTSLSKMHLTKVHTPQSSNQIVLSDNLKGKYHLNEYIKLAGTKKNTASGLKNNKFKIVGFVNSTEYLKKDNIGKTTAGTDSLYGFAYLKKQAFSANNPNFARVSFKNVSGNAYSQKYETKVSNIVKSLQPKLNHRNNSTVSSLRKKINNKLSTGDQAIKVNSTKITSAKSTLQNQQNALSTQLDQARATGNSASISQLSSQQQQLTDKINTLDSQQQALNKSKKKLNQLQDQKKQLSNMTLTIQGRNDYNEGYNNYGEDAQRIDSLGKSFPAFFFLIAILVSFTTMRRMVEEKRIEMGTLRALGYSKGEVMREFLIYSFLTALLGTTVGSFLGLITLPKIIFKAYTANFTFANLQLAIHPWYIVISFIITFLSTVLASWLASRKQLRTNPAELMLPKAPASGSRILLEHISLIWDHLNFSYKVTARNLFRYKGRMLMTIVGVAGATALMITEFGIKDSLNTIVDQQFGNISRYDIITAYNPESSNQNIERAKDVVKNDNNVKKYDGAYFANVYATRNGDYARENISLTVPTNSKRISQYIKLQNYKSGKKLNLSNSGAIISQKLAHLQNVSVGDNMKIHETDGTTYKIKVAGITTMYAGHYIYMNQNYYQKVFNKKFSSNAYLVTLKHSTKKQVNNFAAKFNHQQAAVQTVQSQETKSTITNILSNLNNLIIVLVLSASLLSLVVLYTLTNINISERVRELSTLKVLGFYPNEVLMYIYRETNILTGIEIVLGLGVGYAFHDYIMKLLPPATAMVAPGLSWSNPIISVILMIIFSLIVMIMMNSKIKKIDMLEALKSVD